MTARTELVETIGSSKRKVLVEDVIALRADCKYVVAVHPGGELVLDEPLKDLEHEFGDRFVRTHRSCLVERSRIGGVLKAEDGRYAHVQVKGLAEPVPLSQRHVKAIRKLVADNA